MTKAEFPSGDLSIRFHPTNFSCSGDDNQNVLTMSEGTGHVSIGMSVKVDQGDTTYHVTEVDAERISLSSIFVNQFKMKRCISMPT